MNWLSRLMRRKEMEKELEEELRFHLDQHTGDLIARGSTPEQARRQARMAIGGPEQVKEKCRDARGARWLEDFAQDTRYALRTLKLKPAFAIVTLMMLALGIGVTSVMFAVVNSVLLRSLPFPEPERLVTIHGSLENFGDLWKISYPDFADIRNNSRSLLTGAWAYGGGTISSPGVPEYVDGRKVSAGLFSVLGVAPVRGRAFRSEEDRPGVAPVAMISETLWRDRFHEDPGIIGTTLVLEGTPYTVVGVAPAALQLLGDSEVFTLLGQSTDPRRQNRAARFVRAVARIRPGFSLANSQSDLTLIANQLAEGYPKSNKGYALSVHPLRQELTGDVQGTLWLLLSTVGFVLLIACMNIASLFLTRAISRERELAMRVALGAGRDRLIRQCVTESLVLALCGGLLGLLLAKFSVRPFVALWPGNLPRAEEIHLDWRVCAFAIGVSLLSALFFGLAPAMRVPFHSVEACLRAGGRTVAGDSRRLYGAFVSFQIALAFVLLVCAGMLGRTLLTLSSLDPGLNAHNVLAARFALSPEVLTDPAKIRSAWREVLERTRRVPGLEYSALADVIPMREGENSLPYRTSPTPLPADQLPFALATCTTPDYLKVMGIPLLAGRFLDEHDRETSAPVVVIDENLARHAFGRQNPVGKRLWIPTTGAAPVQIVGVVGHVRHWGLAGDDQSRVRDQIYYSFSQVPDPLLRFFSSVMSIAVRTKVPPANLIEPLRLELRGGNRDQALYEPRTMEDLLSASLARQRFLLFLFGVFAGIALLLATIGIYGVLAYLTGQRIPEIGVRMALGATIRDVMGLVLRQCAQMALAGLSVGIIAALAAAKVLQHLVQGMQSVHYGIFLLMIPVLLAAALIAGLVPALRAGRVNPATALRQE